ncbi:MAG TPA: sulfide/dihydroorotate dehydrogenase-like FAD/NAD-binding protein [Candidatus Protoclostridium stercorigallinarum]|uniref:Sulfide/dihydroorotate dehydrogenase-like FAD/NAD-binding protein n=1 Tax=Candidatus Protoclostridium stercorigallinarum TaxID=2838741 RepID=A0A9D1TQR2_9FIRM|nr:sulfide/dihydroorotate dehydrogenase-like FAD/NAD-binding protein [Candidatus Protoclostridium stercorigallinarum]
MYKILEKRELNPTVTFMSIDAPLVARKAQPGQFVILRVDEEGERIPLTVAGYDREKGSVDIIFQIVGATTMKLNSKKQGESIADFVGPLGNPTETEGVKRACIVGGGVGCAIAYPVAKELHDLGCEVTTIAGFRNKDLVILEDEFAAASDRFYRMSDDGSWGEKGVVTAPLHEMLESGERFDVVIAIGPVIMMKFVTLETKKYDQKTIISMNPIMIDGTGMCGCCRLTVTDAEGNRVTKFACVDGPDFDAFTVDFDEAMMRASQYAEFERKARDEECNLLKKAAEVNA